MGQNGSNDRDNDAPEVGQEPAHTEKEIVTQNQHITQDFRIKKKLGQGNFALVRLCERKTDGKEFAVKIIHKKRLAKPKQQQSLDREVDILKKVNHPYCVSLEAIYETNNHLYLVLEYCQGGELFDMICKHNSFTENQAVKVIKQVNDALVFLHRMGIVHRDIKPENILLLERNPDSVVKLTDFGLANRLDGKDLKFWTSCGTLYYAAPEVLSTSSYDEKIDFWSMGVVMYVLLVGYLPFYHDNRNKTIELIRKGKLHFDMSDWGNISPEARDLIRNLLKVDSKARYGGDQVLDHDWLKLIEGEETQSPKQSLHLEKLGKFQTWHRGFHSNVFTMMGLQRWKEMALELYPAEDFGIGQQALSGASKSRAKKKKDTSAYVPGVGFVIE